MKCWNIRWKTVKGKPTEEEECLRSEGWFEESRNSGLGNGVKIAGQEICRGSENTSCSESKVCRKVQRERKR